MNDALIKLTRYEGRAAVVVIVRGGIAMHITALGLHLSDRCNARCQHCAYHCGPEAEGVMRLGEAREYIQQAVRQGADMVCISGGEPLLFLDLVSKICREARKVDMRSIWIFTNAHWAVNREATEKRLVQLKKAGVTKLCLSVDGFHLPFVPVQRVKEAMTVAGELDLELVLDTRLMGMTLQEDNPVNKATIEILQQLGDLRNVETWRGSPLYVGRAAEVLALKLSAEPGFLGGPCIGPWAGGSWTEPIGVDVDSYGEVTLCPGISIGNAKWRMLSSILSDYNPAKHRIIRDLSAGGPKSLLRVAHDLGYKPLAGYLSACHMCYDIRKYLRAKYPSELTPVSCYEEISSSSDA